MEEREQYRQNIREEIKDLSPPEEMVMPPLRVVNHEIPLINPNLTIRHRPARCPEPLREQLRAKIERYLKAGWWERTTLPSSSPLLVVYKKDGATIRTVIDARQRNDNTLPDFTPMPDQETIRSDVARARFRSKIDLSDAYEQMRVKPEHRDRTVFETIFGNMISNVMQMGDKNGPATFQRLMNATFADVMGVFLHCYQDDIFVFSDTVEEHFQHLKAVFDRLRKQRLYISRDPKKIDILSISLDCLGFIIDDTGIHIDPSKADLIKNWRTPRSYHDVQKFNGVIQYLAQFIPNVTDYSAPLTSMCSNKREFMWTDYHETCFQRLKDLVGKKLPCKPIDGRLDIPIWVITDASAVGVGAWYGQGKSWDTCSPAGFLSRKFTPAQFNYCTWERELLAILEALLRWEDKLLGLQFTVVTDHQALTFFKEAPIGSQRRSRWWEYLARFNFDILYLKGDKNIVADALSRYYYSDKPDETHGVEAYVNADSRLDPEGDDLSEVRFKEIEELRSNLAYVDSLDNTARDRVDHKRVEAAILDPGNETKKPSLKLSNPELQNALQSIASMYPEDPFFAPIYLHPEQYNKFDLHKDYLWTRNRAGERVICVPRGLLKGKSIRGCIIGACHTTVGHLGTSKTLEYIRRWFWWPKITVDVEDFCKSCGQCQVAKSSKQRPPGWVHTMPIPGRPWESVGMDFSGPYPKVKGYDYILLVICRMTGMVHIIPTRTDVTAKQVAELYVREIIRLHGIPESIVSDRDAKFTSQFWTELSRILGQRLLMSSSYHPQTDGSSERAIQTMSQILRALILDYGANWVDQVPLIEFAMNSAVQESTGHAPFELNYGWMPRMIRGVDFSSSRDGVKHFVENINDVLDKTFDKLLTQRTRQAVESNKHRREGQTFKEGDWILLSSKNINLRKGQSRKLFPKSLGPYQIVRAHPETSTYKIELPPDLKARRIHDVFHESVLRPYVENDAEKFPKRETRVQLDIGNDPDEEWVVDAIEDHRWSPNLMFLVRWELGDASWEPLEVVEELEALDRYLELEGVEDPLKLRRN